MATIRVHKRNSTFIELPILVEELSNAGLTEILKKYYTKPFEHEAKSIVAGPSFIQFLNKLFKIQKIMIHRNKLSRISFLGIEFES